MLETVFLSEENRYVYEAVRRLWADAAQSDKPCLFSKVGIGARGCTFRIRTNRQLTLHNAFLWSGRHYFLTSILPDGPLHQIVQGALVEPAACFANADELTPGPYFTGFLTEKYMRYEQEAPLAINELTYVLVTPKAVTLKRGSLVDVGGIAYTVALAHILDPYKNEYECRRMEDL